MKLLKLCVAAGLPPIALAAVGGICMTMFAPTPASGATLTTNAAWTWMKGANSTNQTGTYGTQGVADTANTPGAREGAVSWTATNSALWLFGGYGYGASGGRAYLNDLWKYDPAITNWTWMKGASITNQAGTYGTQGVPAPANTPGARYGAVSWANAEGVLWLFGGSGYPASGGSGYLNDLWKFNPATTNWTWMKGANITNQNGNYGMQGTADPANTPGTRDSAVSWTDNSGALWLFGGWGYPASGGFGRLNDLWKYDPVTTNWTWMKGATTTNQNGNYGTQGVPAPANTPGARYGAVSWTNAEGVLWLFGGYGYPASGGSGELNDLWKYDPATTNWTWIKGANITNQNGNYGTQGVPASANQPGAREYAVSWTDGTGALWLFGGSGYDAAGSVGYLNDLWKYDPATTNWTWIKGANITNQNGNYGTQSVPAATNTPSARISAVSWTDDTGALWLFGGHGYGTSGSSGYLNDLWKYDVFGGIALETNALAFSAIYQGANPAAQMIGMTNVGILTGFTYTNVITYGTGASGWLTVLPAAGAVALNGATVLTNQVNITGLGAGTYYATNQVTADATNSPQSVVITLTVIGVVGPLITANGLVGDVYLNSGAPVTIAVQMMNIEPYLGVEVDWWVVALAQYQDPAEWYYLDSAMQWTSFNGDLAFCQPVYQGPLFNLSSTPVLNGFTLPLGTYDFWFAVDYPMDGILNLNGPILYDNVTVFVQ